MPGSWYSTRHVGKRATLPCFFVITGDTCFLNHVEKRDLAKGGNRRWLETPEVFSTTLRTSEPGSAPITALAIGENVVATLPKASVWPIMVVVMRLRSGT